VLENGSRTSGAFPSTGTGRTTRAFSGEWFSAIAVVPSSPLPESRKISAMTRTAAPMPSPAYSGAWRLASEDRPPPPYPPFGRREFEVRWFVVRWFVVR